VQVVLGYQLENLGIVAGLFVLDLGTKAHGGFGDSSCDDLVEAFECAAADEEDVLRVDVDQLLLRVLAAAFRGHADYRAFEDLEQGLLDAFARYIPCDGDVGRFAGDLVDLVDVDDATFGTVEVEVGCVQEPCEDRFDVVAYVACFGERGGVGNGEGYFEQVGQRLGQQRLSCTGGTDEQDVALFDDHFVFGTCPVMGVDPLVVVVNRYGEGFLGQILSDHVLVKRFLDVFGALQPWLE